ncbi:MAG: sialate O-acetylesterase [Myxococcota bacterium]
MSSWRGGMVAAAVFAWSATAWADAFTLVPEAGEYTLVYELDIPNMGGFNTPAGAPYRVNNTAGITRGFDRIAYHLELDDGSGLRFMFVSVDAFTTEVGKVGVPTTATGALFQRLVSNMNVFTNVAGIASVVGSDTGNIEFWPSNYGQANSANVPGASGSAYDFGDGGGNLAAGYGSMQLHDHAAGVTLLAYNRWGNSGVCDLGIGNSPTGHPDWTFRQNASSYVVKKLQVLVRELGAHGVFENVPEARDYELVYALYIPDDARPFHTDGVPYAINRASLGVLPFDRVAYYLELQAANAPLQYAYASLDTFTTSRGRVGVPVSSTGVFEQRYVDNLNVFSNVPGVVVGEGLGQGNVELWPSDYAPTNVAGIPGADATTYDFGDAPSQPDDGYGSMQIHNPQAQQTVLAFNEWGYGGSTDVGIGNNPTEHPDWTFAANADAYVVKKLYVLVRPSGAPAVSSPEPRGVVQRDAQGRGRVAVEGVCPARATSVEARATPRPGAPGVATAWQGIAVTTSDCRFAGTLELVGGWYDVEVRTLDGNAQLGVTTVERVGVGEVLVIAGQSNAANHGERPVAPSSDLVSAHGPGGWQHAVDPQPVATGSGGSPWPVLGDMLVAQYGVPVGILSVGWDGASVEEWLPGGGLFPRLVDVLRYLGPQGARAVLWHQGESDALAGTSATDYAQRLTTIITASRGEAGFALPWGVALASFQPDVSLSAMEAVVAGQRLVIATLPAVFTGAATDDLVGPAWRYDDVHFNEAGLHKHADRWLKSITSYITTLTPAPDAGPVLRDAGSAPRPDATTSPDANAPDANAPDANAPDANAPDASVPVDDAGGVAEDAGVNVQDAGTAVFDASVDVTDAAVSRDAGVLDGHVAAEDASVTTDAGGRVEDAGTVTREDAGVARDAATTGGGTPAPPKDEGCGCVAGPQRHAGMSWLLLGVLGVAARRRRRGAGVDGGSC